MAKFQIIGLILIIVATVFHLIGFATPYWLYFELAGQKAYYGIWQLCGSGGGTGSTCVEYSDFRTYPDWMKAVQAFACLGLVCLFVSTLCSTLKTWCLKDKTPLLFGSIGSAFAGAACVFLSVVIFGAKREDLFGSTLDLHFSFAFCIIGMIAAIAAGVMMVLELKQGKDS